MMNPFRGMTSGQRAIIIVKLVQTAVMLVAMVMMMLLAIQSAHADEESCKAARAYIPHKIGQVCLINGELQSCDGDRSWHLLTITNGGTVTLLAHLTYHEAEFARARELGEPATKVECDAAGARAAAEKREQEAHDAKDDAIIRAKAPNCHQGGDISRTAGDIKSAEVFQ